MKYMVEERSEEEGKGETRPSARAPGDHMGIVIKDCPHWPIAGCHPPITI